ncbi:MAG: hypothetical protein I8H71_10155 [Xanthomonadaceae bacterium]|nr:hypothetical protein [Xanthomonadaceae bacterium]
MAHSVYTRTSAQSLACFSSAHEIRPRFYPAAPRHDLTVALAELDRATEDTEPDGTEHRLLTMASDWLAQVAKDLSYSHVSDDHTFEFVCTLGDVLALAAGAIALQRGRRITTPLHNASTLIERVLDTLRPAEREAHDIRA